MASVAPQRATPSMESQHPRGMAPQEGEERHLRRLVVELPRWQALEGRRLVVSRVGVDVKWDGGGGRRRSHRAFFLPFFSVPEHRFNSTHTHSNVEERGECVGTKLEEKTTQTLSLKLSPSGMASVRAGQRAALRLPRAAALCLGKARHLSSSSAPFAKPGFFELRTDEVLPGMMGKYMDVHNSSSTERKASSRLARHMEDGARGLGAQRAPHLPLERLRPARPPSGDRLRPPDVVWQ